MARFYQGWFVVAGLFLILSVSSGLGFYNLSVYMNVLAEANGFAVSRISVGVSLFFVVGGVAGMGVAALLERFDVRVIMIAGAALAGLTLGASAEAQELWQLYVLWTLFGIGNGAVSIVTSTTLVTRWFPGANRSLALSVASTGLSMGGVLITPLTARLFNDLGVTAVMPWLGVSFFVLVVPVVVLLIRPHPRAAADGGPDVDLSLGWSYRGARRSRFFILITAGYVLCMGAQVGGISHLYNRAEGLLGYLVAATAVQALTIASIVFRILGGVFIARLPIRWYTLGCLIGQATGLTAIALADSTSGVLLGAGLFGATIGNLLMLQPLWLAEAFGVRDYARIFSLSNALTVLGVATGPVLLGILYDYHDYTVAYGSAATISVLACVTMLAAGRTPRADEEPLESG